MKSALSPKASRLISCLALFWISGITNANASDLAMQADPGRERMVECRSTSGAIIPIVDQQMEVPIKIITGETPDQTVIAYDNWRFADVPRYILLFEQARKCVQITSDQPPADTGRRAPPSSAAPASGSRQLSPNDIDCLAINLLRAQGLITSQELQKIAKFYAYHSDVEKKERGDPRRGKNISGCFRYYKKYKTISPPKSVIIK